MISAHTVRALAALVLVITPLAALTVPAKPDPAEVQQIRITRFVGCLHDERSYWHCPDTTDQLQRGDSLLITVKRARGATRTYRVPSGTDAIFLSLSAVDKFAIPYYTHTVGVDSAAAMRRTTARRLRSQ